MVRPEQECAAAGVAGTFHLAQAGCLSNKADGIRIAAFLSAKGWRWARVEDADLVVAMTCGFTHIQQRDARTQLEALSVKLRPGALFWIGGCLPSINPSMLDGMRFDRLFSPRNLDVFESLPGLESRFKDVVSSRHAHTNAGIPETAALIRVSTGCMDRCSYCTIWRATGRLQSRPITSIVQEARMAAADGATVAHLVGEDLGCYGFDIGVDLLDLCKELEARVPNLKLFLASIHPRHFIARVDRIAKAFSLTNVGGRLSLPVQSGSDRILGLMRRGHGIAELLHAVDAFVSEAPNVELATDFIVGFPSESDDDFDQTVQVLRRLPFRYVDCFVFDEHAGSAASRLNGKVPLDARNQRHRILLIETARKMLTLKGVSSENGLVRFMDDSGAFLPINSNVEYGIPSASPDAALEENL